MKPVFLLFLLFPLAFSSIGSLELDGSISGDGHSELVIIAKFNDSAGKTVFLNLSGPLDVVVKDKTGLVIEHKLVKSGNNTLIYAEVPLDYLRYEISSDSLTSKVGPLWNFELALSSSENISLFNSTMDFPPGTVLKSTNGAVSGYAQSLTVRWKASGIGASQTARMRAGYELAGPQEDYSLLALVLLIAIAITAYLLWPRSKPQAAKSSETAKPQEPALESNAVFKTLDEVDKEIVREIARQKGKTTQATIYLNTHIAKATLSRRLVSLESRGIIQKSQKGNRNLITLSDAFKG